MESRVGMWGALLGFILLQSCLCLLDRADVSGYEPSDPVPRADSNLSTGGAGFRNPFRKNAGERDPGVVGLEEGEKMSLGGDSSSQGRPRQPLGVANEPVGQDCRLESWGEVLGITWKHEREFLADLRQSWRKGEGSLSQFGLCPAAPSHLLSSLKNLAAHLQNPREGSKLHTLQPRQERWEGQGLNLEFGVPAHWRPLQDQLTSALVFYPYRSTLSEAERGVEGLSISFTTESPSRHNQTACFSPDTRYLVLDAEGLLENSTHGHPVYRVHLGIHSADTGSLQQFLIGEDKECNTRMSPTLLVLVDGQTDSRQDSLSIPPPHHWDSTYEFLTELKGFLSAMLRGENKAPPLQLHVDLDSLQSLPHGHLNTSSEDMALLRQLLESHAPTLFRFPRRLEDLRGHRVELVLEADLLELLNTRLTDAVAQIQRQMELQNHGGLPQLQRLLRGCFHLTQGLGVPPEETPANPRQRQYHSLLLLKALQTVQSTWDQRGQRQKPTRQDRSQEHHTDCGLRELSVSLLEYKHILQPKDLSIGNCQGHCRFPLADSDRYEHNNHAVLLLRQHERGPGLERAPCCVPVKYREVQVTEITVYGFKVSDKPNMIAVKCGCR
ncbi:muellerian-inhibiting factor-like [Acipenser oxyrinchus oxyrinchus]|uniref:Muellerian-inhibiting factor-like n=1 Tax=Acipenser oxyrinchus oxyrinchus TaxID=40147 RepID=A0AAD8CKM4_ACIOX|nr:muellerian-inhibiting factor-like [Acipenser oxyrinchus oxyrinchus]